MMGLPIPGISGGAGGLSSSSSANSRSGSIGNTTSFSFAPPKRATDYMPYAALGVAALLGAAYLIKKR